MNIHESAEDYLEAILMLKMEKGFVRSVDIAAKLNVTKPSVSFAMKRLRENDFIHMGDDNLITLTETGEEIAQRMLNRHTTIAHLLMQIGVNPQTAREDACKMEHVISEETFLAIKSHLRSNN